MWASDPVVDAMHKLDPLARIDSVESGPIAGFATVMVEGRPNYVSLDGRFVLQGHLYDLALGLDVTSRRRAAYVAAQLRLIPAASKISFSPRHPSHRVVVFVDIDCPYCRSMITHLDSYLQQGIAIDFVAFPRAGLDSPPFAVANDIWCATNRQDAFRRAFANLAIGHAVCRSAVSRQWTLANELGIPGTPAVIAEDGTYLGGFVPADLLRKKLDQLSVSTTSSADVSVSSAPPQAKNASLHDGR